MYVLQGGKEVTGWYNGYGVGLNCDQAVVGSIPSRAAIKLPRSTQPSIPPGYVNRLPACVAEGEAGRVHLCRVAGNSV